MIILVLGKTPGTELAFVEPKSMSLRALVKESAMSFNGFPTLSVTSTTRIQIIPKLFFVFFRYIPTYPEKIPVFQDGKYYLKMHIVSSLLSSGRS